MRSFFGNNSSALVGLVFESRITLAVPFPLSHDLCARTPGAQNCSNMPGRTQDGRLVCRVCKPKLKSKKRTRPLQFWSALVSSLWGAAHCSRREGVGQSRTIASHLPFTWKGLKISRSVSASFLESEPHDPHDRTPGLCTCTYAQCKVSEGLLPFFGILALAPIDLSCFRPKPPQTLASATEIPTSVKTLWKREAPPGSTTHASDPISIPNGWACPEN